MSDVALIMRLSCITMPLSMVMYIDLLPLFSMSKVTKSQAQLVDICQWYQTVHV